MQLETTYIAWSLLAGFLIIGLLVYERTGLRLGGVLVLPLLLVYALFDLSVVAVFAMAAALALALGQWVHHRHLIYGRRLLYVFLLIGIVGTIAAKQYVGLALGSFVIALLPGLFAYNLHREGRYVAGASTFAIWFGVLLTLGIVALWLHTDPGMVASYVQQGRVTLAAVDFPVMESTGAVAAVGALEALRDDGVAE